jgi:hypothetical protein
MGCAAVSSRPGSFLLRTTAVVVAAGAAAAAAPWYASNCDEVEWKVQLKKSLLPVASQTEHNRDHKLHRGVVQAGRPLMQSSAQRPGSSTILTWLPQLWMTGSRQSAKGT